MTAANGRADPSMGVTVRGGSMSKVEMYGWEIVDSPGRYERVAKSDLHVDHDYQRDHIKHARVNRIAAKWSWVRFGTLSVARRPDGTLWVFDGQHRKLAADKRADIDRLPCVVFTSDGPVSESRFFLDTNGDRGSVQMIDKFKALLAQKDETAEFVQRIVTTSGYKIERGGADFTVQCVGAVYRAAALDAAAAPAAWAIAAEMFAGKPVTDRVFTGLWRAERQIRKHGLGTLTAGAFAAAVGRLTPSAVTKSIVATAEYHGKGGTNAFGEGVIRLLNRGRRTNLIPSLYTEPGHDAE
jgi:hypothetical protein